MISRVLGMNLRLVVLGASLFLAGAIRAQQTDLTKTEPLDVRRDATVEAIERVMPSVVNVEGSADVDPNSADDRLMAEFFGWRLQQVQEAVVPAWSSTKKATCSPTSTWWTG